ncbi:MAG TPA: (2Fe-2S)-binding protein [Acidobacteriota bacterium]|jgi:xanthine dehydrogenase YagT iron-sulfur-binding subunit|nr:(2Fe-2S)-binding protein [Acidobacteriota bacterium]HRR56197.1 (2Fe-2S)-binding protein [Acidobacteriota bacterium]HRV08978.1 (2Fe-2S)-binding protein [Acidobacteriota bacterium]
MSKRRGSGKQKTGLSRRDFFRSGTVGAFTAALMQQEGVSARSEAGTAILGPDKVPIRLLVNGKYYQLSVEPRITLLDALRNELGLTGPKKVCDRGTCGACTVLLNGKAVYACSYLAIEAQGQEIITVEGLGSPEELHPIQQAFLHNDAQQCGFCTPGLVVASKALLDRHPNPTPEEIEKGLGGNLCRCGTYVGVRAAVLEAAGKGGRHA